MAFPSRRILVSFSNTMIRLTGNALPTVWVAAKGRARLELERHGGCGELWVAARPHCALCGKSFSAFSSSRNGGRGQLLAVFILEPTRLHDALPLFHPDQLVG